MKIVISREGLERVLTQVLGHKPSEEELDHCNEYLDLDTAQWIQLQRQSSCKEQNSSDLQKELQPSLGRLQPQIVQKPKVVKCPKCGSTTFDLFKTIEIMDMLTFDDETGKPFLSLMNLNQALADYKPHKDCDRIACSECEEPIPKELFSDLPDQIDSDYSDA